MNLNDLLITYKQVKVPEEVKNIELPDPINSKFDRFMSYLNEKKDKTTPSEKDQDPNAFREFDGGFFGNSNNSSIGVNVGIKRTNDGNDDVFLDNEKQAIDIDNDQPAYLSAEQLIQHYNNALNSEKYTITNRIIGA